LSSESHMPVFVVGSPRSGTSLVVALLLTSGEFPIGQVESFLLERYPLRFGDLASARNRRRFVSHWLTTKQFRRSCLDAQEFAATASAHATSYSEFLGLFFDAIAQRQGKRRWLEKTPSHVFHVRKLLADFPTARVIHVVRDGRDVAASKRKQGWVQTRSSNRTVQLIHAAKAWEQAVLAASAFAPGASVRYLEVRYEDIVENTQSALARIGGFAEVELTMEKVRENPMGVLRESNTHFGDQLGGVERSGVGRWRALFTAAEVLAVEHAIGSTLTALGYALSSGEHHRRAPPFRHRATAATAEWGLALRRRLNDSAIFSAVAGRLLPPE
jgi:Sulfotransferase family